MEVAGVGDILMTVSYALPKVLRAVENGGRSSPCKRRPTCGRMQSSPLNHSQVLVMQSWNGFRLREGCLRTRVVLLV